MSVRSIEAEVSIKSGVQAECGTIIKNECFDTAEYQEVVN